MPLVHKLLEVLDSSLWDRVQLSEYGKTELFVIPMGQDKSPLKTSMFSCGKIEPGNHFVIHTVRVAFVDRVTGRLVPIEHSLWWNSLFNFGIDQKPYVEGPTHLFADPALFAHHSDPRKQQSLIRSILRFLKLVPKLKLRIPFHALQNPMRIDSEQIIRCSVECPADMKLDMTKFDVLVVLDGERYRRVV